MHGQRAFGLRHCLLCMIHNYVVGSHEERRGGTAAGDAERRRKERGLDLYETVNEVAAAAVVEMEMHLLIATFRRRGNSRHSSDRRHNFKAVAQANLIFCVAHNEVLRFGPRLSCWEASQKLFFEDGMAAAAPPDA